MNVAALSAQERALGDERHQSLFRHRRAERPRRRRESPRRRPGRGIPIRYSTVGVISSARSAEPSSGKLLR